MRDDRENMLPLDHPEREERSITTTIGTTIAGSGIGTVTGLVVKDIYDAAKDKILPPKKADPDNM